MIVFASGPYVAGAFFCDQVIEGKDGVMTPVRIIDVVNIQVEGDDVPAEMPTGHIASTLFLLLRAGEARGSYDISLTREDPSGRRESGPSFSVLFNPGGSGVQVTVPVNMEISEPGLYWFDVVFNGALITRVPLEVRYHRILHPPRMNL
jgi:hypothetical protein